MATVLQQDVDDILAALREPHSMGSLFLAAGRMRTKMGNDLVVLVSGKLRKLFDERNELTVENAKLLVEVYGLRNQNAMMTNVIVADRKPVKWAVDLSCLHCGGDGFRKHSIEAQDADGYSNNESFRVVCDCVKAVK